MAEIIDGLKLKGKSPIEIPDTGRDDLPKFLADIGCKVGVEIGVEEGIYSEKLCQAGLKLFSVDPWLDYPGYRRWKMQDRLDKAYATAKAKLAPYDCTIIRKTSMDALKDFEDGSLDFVYIDGHHGFKFVAEDLFEWTKKVKKGGIIAGHDYIYMISAPYSPYACHVKYVVNAFTAAFKIDRWYVLGRRFADPGEKRDRSRSYFWFNPYG
jgi:hypothetical protein